LNTDGSLTLDGSQALPLPYHDRAVGRIDVVAAADAAGSEWPYLLCEARRVLAPGGVLSVATGDDGLRGLLARLSTRVGLDQSKASPANPTEHDGTSVSFTKPNRLLGDRPSVSITIPAYSPRFFEECLRSAVDQNYPDIEILVCDDSGGDEIEAITRRLARQRPIDYRRNPARLGQRGNYGRCFELASGDLIKYLNDDDVLAPGCVERMVDAFRRAPDLVLATSRRQRIDDTGRPLADQPATLPLATADKLMRGISLANVMLMAGLNIVGEPTTVMFRRNDLARAMPDGFRFENDHNLGITDMSMWMPLLLQGDAAYLAEGLSRYRVHSGQLQKQAEVRAVSAANIRALQSRWLSLGLHRRLPASAFTARDLHGGDSPWTELPFDNLPRAPDRSGLGWG
jgi:hypothetical protein